MAQKNTKYSLFVSLIPAVANDFISNLQGYTLICKSEEKLYRFEITRDGVKKPGIILCYILTDARVSFQISGTPSLKPICEQCRNEIIESAKIPDSSQKTITLNGIQKSDLISFLDLEKETGIQVEKRTCSNDSIDFECSLCGDYGARVHISHYTNNTLLFQGVLTEFYVKLSQEIMSLTTSIDSDVILKTFEISNTREKVIDEKLSSHIRDMSHIDESVISQFISTTLVLMNSQIRVGDYGCHTFGLLKAIDAILRKKLAEDGLPVGNTYKCFAIQDDGTYAFLTTINIYNDKLALKSALEDGYTFFHKHRHTTFHVDSMMIESSRILDFDEAIDIVNEGLTIINRICNNW